MHSGAADFFSAFTHLVNLAGGIGLLVGVAVLLTGRDVGPRWYTALRLAVVPPIHIAGIVYNVLLRPLSVPPGSQLDWANEVIARGCPDRDRSRLGDRATPATATVPAAGLVIIFPIVWLAYTFLRGPLVPDGVNGTPYYYPYGFLDPHVAGWAPVIQLVVELTAFALLLGVLAVLIWRIEDRIAAAGTRQHRGGDSLRPGSAT